ncbi:MAG TPA: hypothetical protein VMM15_19635 [Bradyrhizobium sp.]|nr:hypothetical protein [Bradyrhizobium sp.]
MIEFADFRLERYRKAAARAVLLLTFMSSLPGSSQSMSGLQDFFRRNIGLTDDEIAAIQAGKAVVKALPSRTPAEIFLFGAVYIHAAPESYIEFAHDFDRLRNLPGYLTVGVFSDPPQLSDLRDFSFDNDDIKALKDCKPGDCLIQMPATSMEKVQRSVDWSAADVKGEVNDILRKTALERLLRYQREGNHALGVYNDKLSPTDVAQQFAYMLSYARALPERLPDLHRYLLAYPENKPPNIDDAFYWAKVDFGLKPTLRMVQLITMRGRPGETVAYAIAEKQLYSSHYFETALDLSFCVRAAEDVSEPGFYLIMELGSEQAGLTGAKGSIVRKAAVGRSLSNLRNALTAIRKILNR